MLNKFLLFICAILLLGCQTSYKPVFSYDLKLQRLDFQIDAKTEFQLKVHSFKYQPRHSNKVINAFTLMDDINSITIEHIHLGPDNDWTGLPRSVYEGFMKQRLNIKYLEVLSREDFGNYEFTTYKVNKKHLLYFVYIWESNKNTFIYDAKGLLYKKLIHKFMPNIDPVDLPNYKKQMKESIVFNNAVYHFFK